MMNKSGKRRVAAWILLSVFVPMLLLSSLHNHGLSQTAEETCQECVNHAHHSHFGTADSNIDNCVLCQFLTLTYFTASAIVATLLFVQRTPTILHRTYPLATNSTVIRYGRAPPSICKS